MHVLVISGQPVHSNSLMISLQATGVLCWRKSRTFRTDTTRWNVRIYISLSDGAFELIYFPTLPISLSDGAYELIYLPNLPISLSDWAYKFTYLFIYGAFELTYLFT